MPGGIELITEEMRKIEGCSYTMEDWYNILQKVHHLSISWSELAKVKKILYDYDLDFESAYNIFCELKRNSIVPDPIYECEEVNFLVDWLAKEVHDHEYAPVFRFLESCATQLPKKGAERVKQWVEDNKASLCITELEGKLKAEGSLDCSDNPEKLSSENEIVMYVKVAPSLSREAKFNVTVIACFRGKPHPLESPDLPMVAEDLASLVSKLISEVRSQINPVATLSVEMALPFELMNEAVDQWPLKKKRRLTPLLGKKYQVKLRSFERLYDSEYRDWSFWRGRWDSHPHKDRALGNKQIHRRCFDYHLADEFHDELSIQKDTVLVLGVPPNDTNGQTMDHVGYFEAIVEAGIPAVIWARCQDAAYTKLIDELRVNLQEEPFNSYPAHVLNARMGALSMECEHLALLWDDPDQLPPDVEFRLKGD